MTSKVKLRARLLKLYKQTGDEEYRNAAEALKVPLMDHIEQLEIISSRVGGERSGKKLARGSTAFTSWLPAVCQRMQRPSEKLRNTATAFV